MSLRVLASKGRVCREESGGSKRDSRVFPWRGKAGVSETWIRFLFYYYFFLETITYFHIWEELP